MKNIEMGDVLIAHPLMRDPFFYRSVVLIIDIYENNVVGLTINLKSSKTHLEIDNIKLNKLYKGGPVNPEQLFYIHNNAEQIYGGVPIANTGLFLGGDIPKNIDHFNREELLQTNDIKFIIGYSGWSVEQLKMEMQTTSWFLLKQSSFSSSFFFENCEQIWETSLHLMGIEYSLLTQMPNNISSN